MKYLLLLALVLVIVWYWRNSRPSGPRDQQRDPAPGPASAPEAQDMVQCPVCLLHLPRSDALAGPNGRHYCCPEHRLRDGG
jgi:uncharacterized protein